MAHKFIGQVPKERTLFKPFHITPFPVRGALEIGTGGLLSAAVARIDTNYNAIRDMMYHTQMPLFVEFRPNTKILTQGAIDDLRGKMRAVLQSMKQYGNSASAKHVDFDHVALLSHPYNISDNGQEVAEQLSREFHVDVRLNAPNSEDQMRRMALESYAAAAQCVNKCNLIVVSEPSPLAGNGLELTALQQRKTSRFLEEEEESETSADDLEQLIRQGALESLRSSDMQNDKKQKLESLFQTQQQKNNPREIVPANNDELEVLQFLVPFSTMTTHRLLIQEIQHRVKYGASQSPNPVLRSEFVEARDLLTKMIAATLPPWVHTYSQNQCAFVGASSNGGLLNIAARAAGKQQVQLRALEVQGEFHYCGLTDVIIGENYPNPHLILPQIILTSALMRALQTKRIQYLPEISLAFAILTCPHYWIHDRAADVYHRLKADRSAEWIFKQRQFPFPHQVYHRFDPNRMVHDESSKSYSTHPARES